MFFRAIVGGVVMCSAQGASTSTRHCQATTAKEPFQFVDPVLKNSDGPFPLILINHEHFQSQNVKPSLSPK